MGRMQRRYSTIQVSGSTIPCCYTTDRCANTQNPLHRMTIEDNDKELWQRWNCVSREEFTRVADCEPITGRIYHHLAILQRPYCPSKATFDDYVARFFYCTKALTVARPFRAAQTSILANIKGIVAPTKEETRSRAQVSPAARNPLFIAFSHLFLAGQTRENREEHGYDTSKEHHLREFHKALKKIGRRPDPESAGGAVASHDTASTTVLPPPQQSTADEVNQPTHRSETPEASKDASDDEILSFPNDDVMVLSQTRLGTDATPSTNGEEARTSLSSMDHMQNQPLERHSEPTEHTQTGKTRPRYVQVL